MKYARLWLTLFLAVSSQVYADDSDAPELFTRIEHYYVDYRLNDDASAVTTYSWAATVLKESAVAGAKSTAISYSTSIEKAEVLEAYTRKADGKHIDSPPSNFQVEANSGKGKDAPVFSDRTTLTVVFPEVTVGDTVVFTYRITQSEPMFPRHFSTMENFHTSYAYDDVRVSIDAPVSLWAQYEAHGLTEVQNVEKDGRKLLQWSFQNKKPVKNKRKNYTVYDPSSEPGYAFSTFKSYAEIAEAYGARARAKAVVTERVQKQADEIAQGKKTPREQAQALYDWVATNISYAGNCIGVGAVVPHDIAFILDNRMGDCKDHATLLQALLSAKGIASTQALVNAGSGYQLPKIPVVSYVNHVINYIPSLDQYADSTSESTPFGMLPFSVADKPVLWVDGFRDNTRAPVLAPGGNQQHAKSVLKINADGSVSGAFEIRLKGIYATGIRSAMRQLPKDHEAEFVEDVFRSMGHVGSGKFEKDDATALTDTYHYKASFDMKDYIQWPGTGAFAVYPLFINPAPVAQFLAAATMSEEKVDVACSNGLSEEEYVFELPKNMKILSLPEKSDVKNDFLSYHASYNLKGNKLTVKRVFDDRTHGNTCSPAMMAAYKTFAAGVLQNVKAQIVYK